MSKNKIISAVTDLAEKIAKKHKCEIFDVEYKKEGSDYVLRVLIEKENIDEYISIDDCENVNRMLSDALDEENIINTPYILEVSSAGIDRPLRNQADFDKFKGRDIDIGLYKAIDGKKVLTGKLTNLSDGYVFFETNNKEEKIEFKDVAYVKLAVKF